MSVISDYVEFWILSLLALVVISLIAFIIMMNRYRKLRNSYASMLRGNVNADLEDVIIEVHQDIARIDARINDTRQQLEQLLKEKKHMKSHVGVYRYNAYDQHGSDLSFSIAFVDEYSSGAVLTGLHSREQTYLYAKALHEGESPHPLSPEEKVAINLAVNREKA